MTDYIHLQLTAERIQLVPISMQFAKELCVHFTSEIAFYMWPSAPKTQEEVNQYILLMQEKMRVDEAIPMIILKNKTHEFLGHACLHDINSKTPELGIWLKKSAHGHGYGYDAITLLKTWAEANLQYDYLKYPVDKKNLPSRKIAEKLGGEIKDEYTKKSEAGHLLDEVEYRFIKNNLLFMER